MICWDEGGRPTSGVDLLDPSNGASRIHGATAGKVTSIDLGGITT
jgi:hypothetical protein